jgi:hypothetical protein
MFLGRGGMPGTVSRNLAATLPPARILQRNPHLIVSHKCKRSAVIILCCNTHYLTIQKCLILFATQCNGSDNIKDMLCENY